jgi:hypothetical protein
MDTLKSPAVAARTRPPPTGRRAPAAAAPQCLLSPPVLAASNAAAPVVALPLTEGTEAERTRAANLVMQGVLKQEQARDAAVTKLLAQVAELEGRLQRLEQKSAADEQRQLAAEQARQAAEQARVAAAKAAERNRARQLNPACKDFWFSRNYNNAPWNWPEFSGTYLKDAHQWPGVLEEMEDAVDFNHFMGGVVEFDSGEAQSRWSLHRNDQLMLLKEIFNNPDVVDR